MYYLLYYSTGLVDFLLLNDLLTLVILLLNTMPCIFVL